MAIRDAATLTYSEVRSLDMSRTICFWPVSALEVHGPHLPLGMDLYMARWMAEETARRFAAAHPDWTVVQLPALALGADELPLAGSMDAPQRVVYGAVLAHGKSLASAGFRYVVVTNGHGGPRHAAALEAACRRVSTRAGVQMFTPSVLVLHRLITGQRRAAVEERIGRPLSEREIAGLLSGEHAGTWETSFMLADRPELVDRVAADLGPARPPSFTLVARSGGAIAAWWERRGCSAARFRVIVDGLAGGIGWLLNARYGYGGPVISYQGDPSVASADIGAAFRDIMAVDCLEVVEAVASGAMRAQDVRSIASEPIVIQPHFWAKVGLGAAALLALAAM